jgi:hypothetical protein
MLSKRQALAAVMPLTLATACLDRAADQPSSAVPTTMAPAEQAARLGRGASAPAPPVQGKVAGAAEAAEAPLAAMFTARKLIRTGQLTVEVGAYEEAAARVAAVAQSHGGYVAETQASRGARDRQQGTITLRVPAERFAAAFAALKALGKVRTESIGTQDVTKAYTDLDTRLRVKRDAAERLREILRGRTARLADVLEAERELARLTEEIEQMEGERRFYEQQVALSTITVALQEPQAALEPGAFAPIGEALRESLKVLSASVAGLIYVVVFATPWVLIALMAWRTVRAVRRRRAAPEART